MYFMLLSSSESRLSHDNCRSSASSGGGVTSSRPSRGRHYMVLDESLTGTADEDSGRPSIDFPGVNPSIKILRFILIAETAVS
jgi:hypothetical protein